MMVTFYLDVWGRVAHIIEATPNFLFQHRAIVAVAVFIGAAAVSFALHRNRVARRRQQWHNYQQPGGK